jgi:hypothetical protein
MLQAQPKALKPARLSFVGPSQARLLGTALEAQGSAKALSQAVEPGLLAQGKSDHI